MHNLARHTRTALAGGSARVARRGRFAELAAKKAQMRAQILEDVEDQVEDKILNAIADERADGPFVKVSLDDL